MAKRPTMKERIRIYERFLHDLHFCTVTMDNKRIGDLISNASRWSYAHRQGNGEPSDAEQNAMIDSAFRKLIS